MEHSTSPFTTPLRRLLPLLFVLCSGLVITALTMPTQATSARGDWWMFHHDQQHTGRSAFTGSATATQKWAFTTGNNIDSSPSIGADGTVYIGSYDGNLYAINADGTKKWAFLTGGAIWATPAIGSDGTIYVGSQDFNIYAINPDGTKKWAVATGSWACSSPAIGADGTIYAGSGDRKLYAINPDGTKKWTYATGGSTYSAPAIGTDGTIYIGSYDKRLYAITANGAAKWICIIGTVWTSAPAIGADGTIYIGAEDSNLYAINANGNQKWRVVTSGIIDASPAIGTDGTIYVGSEDQRLYAFSPTGSVKWAYTTGGKIRSSAAIGADGVVYVGATDTNLYAINSNGTKKWSFPTGGNIWTSSPCIGADGTVYVGSDDHKLYAIGSTPPRTAIVTPSTGANGTITPSTAQTVNIGANLTFTAAANAGYTVDTWQLDGAGAQTGGAKYTLSNITANRAVKVTFKPLTFTVTPSAGTNGTLSPSSVQTVTYGGSLTFTATANAGYTVDVWQLDGAGVQAGKLKYTLSNITANRAVKVTFKPLTPVGRGDWWMFHHDARHSGRSPFTGPGAAALKWAFSTGGIGSSPVFGIDGTIYVGAKDMNLYALSTSGAKKWAFATGGMIDGASPAVGLDGTIYVGSQDHYLYALNPDGTRKWKFATTGIINSSPAIGTDGTIYVGSGDYNLYAINPNGTKKWAYATKAAINMSSPAIDATGIIYIGSCDNKLYALNPTGTLKWTYATHGIINSSPAIGSDGTIYVGSQDNHVYAITPSGTTKWVFATGDWVISSPAIGADGTIYVGSADKNFYAITADGKKKWAMPTGNYILSSPAIGADGTLYIGSEDSNIYAINTNGTQKWSFGTKDLVKSSPTIGADGTLYVGSYDGKLYALDAHPLITTPSSGANGTISPNAPVAVTSGGSVTFTATVNTGNTVDSWSLDTKSVQTGGTKYTLSNITANHAVKVTFKPLVYTITASAGANGSISPSTPQTVTYGSNLTFTATASYGYTAASWTVDGKLAQTGGAQYPLKNVTANHAVKVTFVTTVTVIPSHGPNGSITPGTSQKVPSGGSITFTATANAGYTVDSWSVNSTVTQTGGGQYTLKNVLADTSVAVAFKVLPPPNLNQPDLAIKSPNDTGFTGDHIYSTDGKNETVSVMDAPGGIHSQPQTYTYTFYLRNDGATADTFTLKLLDSSPSLWTIQVSDPSGNDITSAIKAAAGCKTDTLVPRGIAGTYTFTLKVPAQASGSAKQTITAIASKSSVRVDVVVANTSVTFTSQ